MISMDKEYKTRDGQDVMLLCTDRPLSEYCVVGLIIANGNSEIECWDADGEYGFGRNAMDLIEVVPYVPNKGDIVLVWRTEEQHIKYLAEYDSTSLDGIYFVNKCHLKVWENCGELQ